MKKQTARLATYIFLAVTAIVSCGQKKADCAAEEPVTGPVFRTDAEGLPVKEVFEPALDASNCFLVISKVHQEHLCVYEVRQNDTVLLAFYPACLSRNKGPKERPGDLKTPESYPGEPFTISEIADASTWCHDFSDGRGSIPAYGQWFLRLAVPGVRGIGIHGSTGNRQSIASGRDSEGCIRLLDEDIIHLHDNYVQVGTRVIILPEGQGPLPFQTKALEARLNPVHGNR